ncbi:phage portal protein [Azospirillum sp. Vi22]|uniref:phage portal protein n=1 Tax=Azospirillum baldaniorum TaxID=1064539 RepID=UPI00157BABCE|nr:phage portal protein [Azospirillum baldaniorum]NUB09721.1 phage portal protein [Azospirillum baldaniorum]
MLGGIKAIFKIGECRSAGSFDFLLGGTQTNSGISINTDTAMRVPGVFAAVRILAETVAQLPVVPYRRLADGGREKATDHRSYALLTDGPNDWTDASLFKLNMTAALVTAGNSYAFVNRDGSGQPLEMIQLDTGSVAVDTDAATMEPRYFITDANGTRREYDRRDILHLRTFGLRGHTGLSPVMQAREAIGLAAVLEAYAAGLFGRGARPAGVLKAAGRLSHEQLQRLRASLTHNYVGAGNSGKVLLLEDGVTFEPHQITSADSQFLELRRFQLAEIARIWRIPLSLLNDLGNITHANAEALGQQFLTFTLLPYLKMWQGALNRTLLNSDERKELYFEFEVNDLARADLNARMKAYATAIAHGIYNPNEIREFENKGSYVGGEVYSRPLNAGPMTSEGGSNGNP